MGEFGLGSEEMVKKIVEIYINIGHTLYKPFGRKEMEYIATAIASIIVENNQKILESLRKAGINVE